MRKNTCLSLILGLCCLYNQALSQSEPNPSNYTKTIDIIPPSPNAAALAKFGGIPLNYSTGMMNLNIPVYDYASKNIHVPISLSYSSAGLRVDEIASRAGISWVLNAGGVISRTVFGRIDETSQRASLPADWPIHSTNLVNFMESQALSDANGGVMDAQPDVFSFNVNGNSGKFMLDAANNPVLLTYSNIRIESDFSPSAAWNFRITTGDGVQYQFGVAAAETSNKSQSGTGCGKIYVNPATTAWYLTQIIHPDNDTITFSYTRAGMSVEAGATESIFQRNTTQVPDACAGYNVTPPTLTNNSCLMRLSTQTAFLQEINSSGGARVRFIYIDRNDVTNDKLLSGIEVYKPGESSPFKLFSFDYQYGYATGFLNKYSNADASLRYRPFLTAFTEKSPDNLLTKKHLFSYNDINGLPPRLSYAQDTYGFFNGKNNNTLIPKPSTYTWQQVLPLATADRIPDPAYCPKGLLSKITYPTGGQDSIVYEGNTVYKTVPVYQSPVTVSASLTNDGIPGQESTTSATIPVGMGQSVVFSAGCGFDAGLGYASDPIHDRAIVRLLDLTSGNTIIEQNLTAGSYVTPLADLQQGHTYQISVSVSGGGTTGTGSLTYLPGSVTYQDINQITGGVRIAKVITSDNATATPQIKKYSYSSLARPGISSAGLVYEPIYEKYLPVYVTCGTQTPIDPNNPATFLNCSVTHYDFYSMYSNTQNNLYAYPSAPVSYGAVVESFGDNYENGGIERQYTVATNLQGNPLIGDFIQGAPLSDYSWRNGREVSQFVFNKQGSSYIPVKKVYTHYNEDARIGQELKAYIVNKKYAPFCQGDPPSETEVNAYDMTQYSLFREWAYVDSIRTLTYDNNGQNYVEELLVTNYANQDHAMPTSISSVSSDNQPLVVNNTYPYDIVLSGSAETARQALIAKHIIAPVLQQQSLRGGANVFTARTDYAVFPNGLVLPQSQFLQTGNNPIEKRVDFAAYNNSGRLLEQSKANDVKLAYQWGYNSLYPVAQAANARSNEIFFSGFEEGGWDGNMTAYDNTKTHTGMYSGRIDKPGSGELYSHSNTWLNVSLSAPVKYRYSGWVYSTGPSVELFLFMKRAGETSYFTYVDANVNYITGQWVYMEKEFTVPADVTQLNIRVDNNGGGTVWFDDIRLCPSAARMTTYTYDPLVGLTSQCDDRNNLISYEYDKLGRLLRTRDLDNNILRQYDYQYQAYYHNSPVWMATGNTRCKPCPANGSYISNVLQQEEKDVNVQSGSYNTTRWTDIGTSTACVIMPDWQNTSTATRCKIDGSGNNTSEIEQQQQDMNPCSGLGTRWVVVATNCTTCPKPANWQPTGNVRCVKDASNNNTGYQEHEEQNIETCSNNYGATQWISNGIVLSACPTTIYAKIRFANTSTISGTTSADLTVNFYADAACTISSSVGSSLTVNYKSVRTLCSTGSTLTSTYSASGSGSSISLGNQILSVNDGIHCYNYAWSVTSGTGYVAK